MAELEADVKEQLLAARGHAQKAGLSNQLALTVVDCAAAICIQIQKVVDAIVSR